MAADGSEDGSIPLDAVFHSGARLGGYVGAVGGAACGQPAAGRTGAIVLTFGLIFCLLCACLLTFHSLLLAHALGTGMGGRRESKARRPQLADYRREAKMN